MTSSPMSGSLLLTMQRRAAYTAVNPGLASWARIRARQKSPRPRTKFSLKSSCNKKTGEKQTEASAKKMMPRSSISTNRIKFCILDPNPQHPQAASRGNEQERSTPAILRSSLNPIENTHDICCNYLHKLGYVRYVDFVHKSINTLSQSLPHLPLIGRALRVVRLLLQPRQLERRYVHPTCNNVMQI